MTLVPRRLQRRCPDRLFTGRVWLGLEELEARSLPSGSGTLSGQLATAYGLIPLSFEANEGQTDPPVQFLARGPGYAVFLTGSEAVLSLQRPPAQGTGVVGPLPDPVGTALRL